MRDVRERPPLDVDPWLPLQRVRQGLPGAPQVVRIPTCQVNLARPPIDTREGRREAEVLAVLAREDEAGVEEGADEGGQDTPVLVDRARGWGEGSGDVGVAVEGGNAFNAGGAEGDGERLGDGEGEGEVRTGTETTEGNFGGVERRRLRLYVGDDVVRVVYGGRERGCEAAKGQALDCNWRSRECRDGSPVIALRRMSLPSGALR